MRQIYGWTRTQPLIDRSSVSFYRCSRTITRSFKYTRRHTSAWQSLPIPSTAYFSTRKCVSSWKPVLTVVVRTYRPVMKSQPSLRMSLKVPLAVISSSRSVILADEKLGSPASAQLTRLICLSTMFSSSRAVIMAGITRCGSVRVTRNGSGPALNNVSSTGTAYIPVTRNSQRSFMPAAYSNSIVSMHLPLAKLPPLIGSVVIKKRSVQMSTKGYKTT